MDLYPTFFKDVETEFLRLQKNDFTEEFQPARLFSYHMTGIHQVIGDNENYSDDDDGEEEEDEDESGSEEDYENEEDEEESQPKENSKKFEKNPKNTRNEKIPARGIVK